MGHWKDRGRLPTETPPTDPPTPSLLMLPLPALQLHLLPHLTPPEAIALGRGNHALWQRTNDSDFWHAACLAVGWVPKGQEDLRQYYCWQASRRCKHCAQPTAHVFRLLCVRLCERCERENPHHYTLVTATEAVERFGIDPQLLPCLRKHYDRDLQLDFFLRRDVAAICALELPTPAASVVLADPLPPEAVNPKRIQKMAARQEALEKVLQQKSRTGPMDVAVGSVANDGEHCSGGSPPHLGSSGSDDPDAEADDRENLEKEVQREIARRALEARRASRKAEKEARRASRKAEKEARKRTDAGSGVEHHTAVQEMPGKEAKPRKGPDTSTVGLAALSNGHAGDVEHKKLNLKWAKAQLKKAHTVAPAAWRTQLGKAVALGTQFIQDAAVQGGYVLEEEKISQASGQFAISGLLRVGEDNVAPAALPLQGDPPNRTERRINLGKRGKT